MKVWLVRQGNPGHVGAVVAAHATYVGAEARASRIAAEARGWLRSPGDLWTFYGGGDDVPSLVMTVHSQEVDP